MILANFIGQQSLSYMVEQLRPCRDVASSSLAATLDTSTNLDGPRPAEEATLVPRIACRTSDQKRRPLP